MPSVEPNETSKPLGQQATNSLFSTIKPVDAPNATKQTAPNGLFPSLTPSSSSLTTTNIFSKQNGQLTSTELVNGDVSETTQQTQELQNYFSEMGEVPDSVIESKCPAHFDEEQRLQFFAAYRVRALNKGIKEIFEGGGLGMNFEPVLYHYKMRRDEINTACETGLRNLKRRRGELVEDDDNNSPAKRQKHTRSTSQDQNKKKASSPEKRQQQVNNGGETSPQKRSQPRTDLSPSKSQFLLNGSTTPKAPAPAQQLLPDQNAAAMSPSPKGKRKAEVQITQLDPEGESTEKLSQKTPKLNGSTGSETSNLFKKHPRQTCCSVR